MAHKNPSAEQLKLTQEEYDFLCRISGHMLKNASGAAIVIANPAINNISLEADTLDFSLACSLLERNMIKHKGPTSKTSLRKQKISVEEWGDWQDFYIGGGTLGRQAQYNFYVEQAKLDSNGWRRF